MSELRAAPISGAFDNTSRQSRGLYTPDEIRDCADELRPHLNERQLQVLDAILEGATTIHAIARHIGITYAAANARLNYLRGIMYRRDHMGGLYNKPQQVSEAERITKWLGAKRIELIAETDRLEWDLAATYAQIDILDELMSDVREELGKGGK